jgi:hypothetical protein
MTSDLSMQWPVLYNRTLLQIWISACGIAQPLSSRSRCSGCRPFSPAAHKDTAQHQWQLSLWDING